MNLPTGMPADAPSTTVEATTTADVARVWDRITDPAHPVGASPELVDAWWLDGGPALGAHFRGVNRRDEREWSTTSTVTGFVEHERYQWTVEALDDPISSWTYELEGSEAGTRIRFTCRLGPGPSGLTAAHARQPDRAEEITDRRLEELRSGMRATVDQVVADVESSHTPLDDRPV